MCKKKFPRLLSDPGDFGSHFDQLPGVHFQFRPRIRNVRVELYNFDSKCFHTIFFITALYVTPTDQWWERSKCEKILKNRKFLSRDPFEPGFGLLLVRGIRIRAQVGLSMKIHEVTAIQSRRGLFVRGLGRGNFFFSHIYIYGNIFFYIDEPPLKKGDSRRLEGFPT